LAEQVEKRQDEDQGEKREQRAAEPHEAPPTLLVTMPLERQRVGRLRHRCTFVGRRKVSCATKALDRLTLGCVRRL
jgi:hypothetical protein